VEYVDALVNDNTAPTLWQRLDCCTYPMLSGPLWSGTVLLRTARMVLNSLVLRAAITVCIYSNTLVYMAELVELVGEVKADAQAM
jgi:hypothetical protein